MNYYEYIQSAEWQARANEAKRRALYRCQICNSPNNLIAHHRTYNRLGKERPEDITILCSSCHDLFSNVTGFRLCDIDLSWKPPAFNEWVARYA